MLQGFADWLSMSYVIAVLVFSIQSLDWSLCFSVSPTKPWIGAHFSLQRDPINQNGLPCFVWCLLLWKVSSLAILRLQSFSRCFRNLGLSISIRCSSGVLESIPFGSSWPPGSYGAFPLIMVYGAFYGESCHDCCYSFGIYKVLSDIEVI